MNSKQNHNLNVFIVEFQKAITIYAPEGTCVHASTHTQIHIYETYGACYGYNI